MTELCKIMTEYGSDKGSGHHNYTVFYTEIFKNKNIKNVFELGLGTNNPNLQSSMGVNGKPGASLRGWKHYFPDANIYGADIDKDILFTEPNIVTFFCDQRDEKSVRHLWSQDPIADKIFDIIIDDGLHEFEANLTFFKNSIHKLAPGGIFIIEDVLHYEVNKFANIIDDLKKQYLDLKFDIVQLENQQNQSDNNLIVIYKNA
jgi:hypothetical protein